MYLYHRVWANRSRFRRPGRWSRGGSILVALMLLEGCGSESPRRAVRGTVSVDQTVIARGSISFFPDRGHAGPAASTAIVDGNYRFTEINGPTAGRHRVVIGMETDPQGVKGSDAAVPSASVIKGGPTPAGREATPEGRSSPDAIRQTQ
ncbi:MAG: hypothetical protein ACO1RT_02170, partial [Planctomycetaceae bacterium]